MVSSNWKNHWTGKMLLNLTILKMYIIQIRDHNQEHTCKSDKLQSHQFGSQEITYQTGLSIHLVNHQLLRHKLKEKQDSNLLIQWLHMFIPHHWTMLALMKRLTLLTFQVSTVKFWDKMVPPIPDQPPIDSKEIQNMFLHMLNKKRRPKDGTMAGTSFHQWLTEKRSSLLLTSHLQTNITTELESHHHNTQTVHLMHSTQMELLSNQTKFECDV